MEGGTAVSCYRTKIWVYLENAVVGGNYTRGGNLENAGWKYKATVSLAPIRYREIREKKT